jgi:putative transcriptional regulator
MSKTLDSDNRPLTDADLKRMKRTPQVKIIRRALKLTQEEFAAQFHIPIGTLRDWEQDRNAPDKAAQAYLRVIAKDPDAVSTAPENRATWRSKKGPGGARKVRHWLSLCTHGKGPRGGPFHVRRRFRRAQALRISPVSGSMVSAVSAGCPARRFRADEVFNR